MKDLTALRRDKLAYDKIIPIRSRMDHCMGYVLNPEKTELAQVLSYMDDPGKNIVLNQHLAVAINCNLETALEDMMQTKARWGKTGGVLGYHLIHSFAPGEVTPEQAHEIGVEFANRLLREQYEAVVSTHLDQEHLHCHILFNSVSFADGRKYRDSFRDYYGDIRGNSNEVSQKYGLSVIDPKGKGKPYNQWEAEKQGKQTVRDLVREDIDKAIASSFTYQSFYRQLEAMGYTVKRGPNVKYIAVCPPGGSRFIRLNSLGERYTENGIKARLAELRFSGPTKPQPIMKRYVIQKRPARKNARRTGFQALYCYYLCFLGIRRPKKKQVIPFNARKEVVKLERYVQQFRFLQRYEIHTETQLSMLTDAMQAKADHLIVERKLLYQEKRRGGDVSEKLARINMQLREIRTEIRLCQRITEDVPKIKQQLEETQIVEKSKEPVKSKIKEAMQYRR